MATYSGASPTPGTAATVIEDPAGVEPDADEPPNAEQPASSRPTAAQAAAIRMRPPPTRWADRPIRIAFIGLQVKRADSRTSGHHAGPERTLQKVRRAESSVKSDLVRPPCRSKTLRDGERLAGRPGNPSAVADSPPREGRDNMPLRHHAQATRRGFLGW